MTKNEILKEIKKCDRDIEKSKNDIEVAKCFIAGCRKAKRFWKNELKKSEKGVAK